MFDHAQNGAMMDAAVLAPTAPGTSEMAELFQTINPLTGTSMKILLFMLISGRSYSTQHLRQMTGISRKTLKRSMGQLAFSGAVYRDGSQRWRISHPWRAFISISIMSGQLAEIEQLAGRQVAWLPGEVMPEAENTARLTDKSDRQEDKDTLHWIGSQVEAGVTIRPTGKTIQTVAKAVRHEDKNVHLVNSSPDQAGKADRRTEKNVQRKGKTGTVAGEPVQNADKGVQVGVDNVRQVDKNVLDQDKNVRANDLYPGSQPDPDQPTIVVKELSDKKNIKNINQQHQTRPLKQTKLSESYDQGERSEVPGTSNERRGPLTGVKEGPIESEQAGGATQANLEEVGPPGADRPTGDGGTGSQPQEGSENGEENEAGPLATGNKQVIQESTGEEHTTRRERKKILARYLKRAGIIGNAFSELLNRSDLQLDPRPVLAWWWYALAREDIKNPAALAIRCLQRNDAPPVGFMELVSLWPRVTSSHREHIEDMIQRNWSAEDLVRSWQRHYPEVTSRACVAMKELYLEHPDALGYR